MINPLKQALKLVLITSLQTSFAGTYVLPEKGDVVGENQVVYPKPGETLSEVGIRYDLGFNEMVKANPRVDPVRPLSPKTKLVLPMQLHLPKTSWKGVVIDLKRYRLYYFPQGDNVVLTYPVGIGRAGWDTPVGTTKIVAKETNPVWRPTAHVRTEALKNGTPIPDKFPPGPNNPLGQYAFRLGWPEYLIHGTNHANGVGMRVSAGCIRMLPKDVKELYEVVPLGTVVKVL